MNGRRFRPSVYIGGVYLGGRDPHYVGDVVVLGPDAWQPPAPWSGPTIPVGVIDTGILLDNGAPPDWAAGRVVCDEANADTVSLDDPVAGHGTFVTALLLGEAPNAVVYMKGVIDHTANEVNEDHDVANSITELSSAGVKLINMSFSGTTNEPGPPKEIMDALNALDEHTVVVAAAGNDASEQHVFPACLKPKDALMVAVGAVDESVPPLDDTRLPAFADFSNNGRWLRAVASGVYVIGPGHPGYPSSGCVARSGTSLSAALVTGRIAATAHERGISVRAAADALLDRSGDDVELITAYGVNGPYKTPYVRAKAASHPREW